jgi:hypothetical protein
MHNFPFVSYCWWWLFNRWAETSSTINSNLLHEDCCDKTALSLPLCISITNKKWHIKILWRWIMPVWVMVLASPFVYILYFHKYAFKLHSYILQLCIWEGQVRSAMEIGISVLVQCYIHVWNSGLKGNAWIWTQTHSFIYKEKYLLKSISVS